MIMLFSVTKTVFHMIMLFSVTKKRMLTTFDYIEYFKSTMLLHVNDLPRPVFIVRVQSLFFINLNLS